MSGMLRCSNFKLMLLPLIRCLDLLGPPREYCYLFPFSITLNKWEDSSGTSTRPVSDTSPYLKSRRPHNDNIKYSFFRQGFFVLTKRLIELPRSDTTAWKIRFFCVSLRGFLPCSVYST